MSEQPRFDARALAPDVLQRLAELDGLIAHQIEPGLFHLLKIRASQINGCAYCLDMHTHEALADGEAQQRLFVLDGWRDSPVFTDKERAVLAWTEAVTRISETHAPKAVYDELKAHFSESEIAYLTLAASMINTWNRLAISAKTRHKARVQAASASRSAA